MNHNHYEYVATIVPGTIILVTISSLYPSILPVTSKNLSLGDLGLTLIFAFVCGHLLHFFGGYYEKLVWWIKGGMPSSWINNKSQTLLSDSQMEKLSQIKSSVYGIDEGKKVQLSDVREFYSSISSKNRSKRVDIFNNNYGLMRSLSVAFLASAIVVFVDDLDIWVIGLVLFIMGIIATFRMVHFGVCYARELYVELISLESYE